MSDTLAMGDDTVHAIQNPLGHSALAVIHVYGGDLLGTARSMWTAPGCKEQPYDDTKVLGSRRRPRGRLPLDLGERLGGSPLAQRGAQAG